MPNSKTPLLLREQMDTLILSDNYKSWGYPRMHDSFELPSGSKLVTHVYKPLAFNISNEDKRCIGSDSSKIGNKYYRIIQIFQPKESDSILKKLCVNESTMGRLFHVLNFSSNQAGEPFFLNGGGNCYLIQLKIENSNDTVYYVGEDIYELTQNLIIVENFVKLKQLFDGKYFIVRAKDIDNYRPLFSITYNEQYTDKNGIEYYDILTNDSILVKYNSIWKCEVTLLPIGRLYAGDDKPVLHDPVYTIAFILNNNNHKIIIRSRESYFEDNYASYNYSIKDISKYKIRCIKSKKEFIFLELSDYDTILDNIKKENNANQSVLLNKEKEAQKNQELLKTQHHQLCVTKFGEDLGTLIADSKITLGMTEEMCLFAWGEPWDKTKITNDTGVHEIWSFGYGKKLYFLNNELIQILE
jgi:hypothetical protein